MPPTTRKMQKEIDDARKNLEDAIEGLKYLEKMKEDYEKEIKEAKDLVKKAKEALEIAEKTAETEPVESDKKDEEASDVLKSPSRGSEDTPGEAGKRKYILVSSFIKLDNDNGEIYLEFYINQKQRPDVLHVPGESQGDHTTSYVTILEVILNSINSTNIVSAKESIIAFGKRVLDKEEWEKFLDIKAPKFHETKERKLLIEIAKKAFKSDSFELNSEESKEREDEVIKLFDDLKKEEKKGERDGKIKLLNNELKLAKVAMLANYLCELSSSILERIQAQELTSLYSKNRVKLKSAGESEKSAARALTMLNRVCELHLLSENGKTEEFEQKLKSFIKSLTEKDESSQYKNVVKYGFNAWYRGEDDKSVTEKRDDFENGLKTKAESTLKEFLGEIKKDKIENLISYIGDLIDYDYKLEFDFKNSKKEIIKLREEIKNKFSEGKHNFENKIRKMIVTRTNIDDLVRVLERFFIIMGAAFPSLKEYMDSDNLSEAIYKNWLKREVLEKGWGELEVKGLSVKLSDEYLMNAINKELEEREKSEEKSDEKEQSKCIML